MKDKNLKIDLILLVVILFIFIIINYNKQKEILITNQIEVNSMTSLYSIINKSNSDINTKDYLINSEKLGTQDINLSVKEGKNTKNYEFVINVVDTEKPFILGNKEIKTIVNEEINLLKNVFVTDNYDSNLEIKIIGSYDFNKEGIYKLKYFAKDSSNNETFSDFTLIVNNIPEKYYITSKGYKLLIKDGVSRIDNTIIVNKSYNLPSNYGSGLTTEMMNNFYKMKNDAKKQGLNIFIKSGFRSYWDQKAVYNNWVNQDGKTKADTYSARPGHSEHQTGLAIDLNIVNDSFKNTNEFKWLNENSYKYGFILRYPENKQDITGYKFEPWHYRYVGYDLAEKLYNDGNWITIEEYFGIDSKY